MATKDFSYWIELAKRYYADTGDLRALTYAVHLTEQQQRNPPGMRMDSLELPHWLFSEWLDHYHRGDESTAAIPDES